MSGFSSDGSDPVAQWTVAMRNNMSDLRAHENSLGDGIVRRGLDVTDNSTRAQSTDGGTSTGSHDCYDGGGFDASNNARNTPPSATRGLARGRKESIVYV